MSWKEELEMQKSYGLRAIKKEGCKEDALYVQRINQPWEYNPMPSGRIKKKQRAQMFVKLFLYDHMFNHGSANDEKQLSKRRENIPLSELIDYAA